MPTTERLTRAEVATLGAEIFERRVNPALQPADDGKFVAIDVTSDEFEMDADDYKAVMRLRSRMPDAGIWLARAGSRTTCRIGVLP